MMYLDCTSDHKWVVVDKRNGSLIRMINGTKITLVSSDGTPIPCYWRDITHSDPAIIIDMKTIYPGSARGYIEMQTGMIIQSLQYPEEEK